MNLSLNAWWVLAAAGLLEVVWALSMKASAGFSKPVFTVITFMAAGLSFWLLSLALKQLPVGTAYAVWTGMGAVGAALFGMLLFKEPATLARLVCISLIVVGIFGLQWMSADAGKAP